VWGALFLNPRFFPRFFFTVKTPQTQKFIEIPWKCLDSAGHVCRWGGWGGAVGSPDDVVVEEGEERREQRDEEVPEKVHRDLRCSAREGVRRRSARQAPRRARDARVGRAQ